MLKVDRWNKSFGAHHVLKNVNFLAGTGETVTIIGASGSGKSTFLRTLNYLETPDSGTLSVGTSNLKMKTYKAGKLNKKHIIELRRKSAMVFQSFNLFRSKTALENVMEALTIVKKIGKKDARELALSCLAKVGLSDRVDYYPHMLSGGQQQRVSIARALAIETQVILFDEPTSALDPEMIGEVLNVIRSISHKSMTLIIVTHEMRFAREVSDRVCFFGDGYIMESGTPAEIFDHPQHEKTQKFLRSVQNH